MLAIKTNQSISTFKTFVAVHKGDAFNGIRNYSALLQKLGMRFTVSEPNAFEAVWCGWGYGRKFTIKEIEETLPKVKELGIKWVDIDDGYQTAMGDWNLNKKKFPRGNVEMKELVSKIHNMGLKAKLWWAPLAIDSGTILLQKDSTILLKNKDGSNRKISWWNSMYMSPLSENTWNHTREMVILFIKDWGFDGFKLDGQYLNSCPPDYTNRNSKTDNPELACKKWPLIFKMIFDETRKINQNAIIQICPCGDCCSIFNIPYMNQSVASDPTSSLQIRQKGKIYKAINPKMAYYAEHVETTDGGDDFATQLGIGGVIGTRFTWPKDNPNPTQGNFLLTPEHEIIWKKWISI